MLLNTPKGIIDDGLVHNSNMNLNSILLLINFLLYFLKIVDLCMRAIVYYDMK